MTFKADGRMWLSPHVGLEVTAQPYLFFIFTEHNNKQQATPMPPCFSIPPQINFRDKHTTPKAGGDMSTKATSGDQQEASFANVTPILDTSFAA